MKYILSAESVTEGHPDKVCDAISDAVLDACLAQDPMSRVACETTACKELVHLMGEITTTAQFDPEAIAREVILDIGYDRDELEFNGSNVRVLSTLTRQSADIAMGVNTAIEVREGEGDILDETGAGDQGMVFGYACNETPEFMPLTIQLSHALTRRLTAVRKDGTLSYLRPDGKALVAVEYEDGKPVAVKTVVIAAQHDEDVALETLQADIIREVILPCVPAELLNDETRFIVNGTGRFVIGGPVGDSGLTGRKIIVDTYGGMAPHGGGAFSGKDPTKVDRSAAYAARWIAKNVVAAGLAERCELQIAYCIGVARPVSVFVDDFGTGKVSAEKLSEIIRDVFDLRPAAIIRDLELRRPIYRQTAAYGHFGRHDLDLPWERLNRVDELRAEASL